MSVINQLVNLFVVTCCWYDYSIVRTLTVPCERFTQAFYVNQLRPADKLPLTHFLYNEKAGPLTFTRGLTFQYLSNLAEFA